MLWNPTLLLVLLIFLLFPRFLLACCLCVTLHITFLLNLIQQRRAKVIYITVLRIPENQVEDENLSVFSLMVKTKLKQNGKIKPSKGLYPLQKESGETSLYSTRIKIWTRL